MANISILGARTTTLTPASFDNIYIGRDGTIVDSTGILATNIVDLDIIIDGAVIGLGGNAIRLLGTTGEIDISLGNGGRVSGSSGSAIFMDSESAAELNVTNAGTIQSNDGRAIFNEGDGATFISNTGEITATGDDANEGDAIVTEGALTLRNDGTIT
ncbi:MAG: hypothetical protein AAFR74_04535, partial [Pseudomonadota bacterium]